MPPWSGTEDKPARMLQKLKIQGITHYPRHSGSLSRLMRRPASHQTYTTMPAGCRNTGEVGCRGGPLDRIFPSPQLAGLVLTHPRVGPCIPSFPQVKSAIAGISPIRKTRFQLDPVCPGRFNEWSPYQTLPILLSISDMEIMKNEWTPVDFSEKSAL